MFDIIGDIHGCAFELFLLLEKLGYKQDISNGTIIYHPPEGRKVVFVGDLVDRGYSSGIVYCFVRDMINAGYALLSRGNHDDKLMRWAKGNNVILNHGIDETIKELEQLNIKKEEIFDFLNSIPMYLSFDDERLIVVHGAWNLSLKDIDPFHKKCKKWCLYGPTTGKMLPNGFPDRIDWVISRKEYEPIIIYGHQPYKEVRICNGTYGIDTGCVFGGRLTCLCYPELEIVYVNALEKYSGTNWYKGE